MYSEFVIIYKKKIPNKSIKNYGNVFWPIIVRFQVKGIALQSLIYIYTKSQILVSKTTECMKVTFLSSRLLFFSTFLVIPFLHLVTSPVRYSLWYLSDQHSNISRFPTSVSVLSSVAGTVSWLYILVTCHCSTRVYFVALWTSLIFVFSRTRFHERLGLLCHLNLTL